MEKKQCHIWHHNDNDGRLSAYIAARGLRMTYGEPGIFFHEMDYSKKPDFSGVGCNDTCVITDFSFDAGTMLALLGITEDVIWIDHHATAIEALGAIRLGDGNPIKGMRRTADSATLIAWEYFYALNDMVPGVVRLVDDYDAWKHKMDGTVAFHLASAVYDTDPGLPDDLNFWAKTIYGDALPGVLGKGREIREYVESTAADRLKRLAWIGRMPGYDGDILCLSGVRGSKNFDTADPRPDVLCAYEHTGDRFTVSLYSDSGVDVSELCKQHGGGGHKGAAGFICKELPITFVRKYGG